MTLRTLTIGAIFAAPCAGQVVLQAHPPPSNSGLGWHSAIFFDLEAVSQPVVITGLTTATGAGGGQDFHFDLLVRDGTSLGGSATSGPGSSMDGWVSLGEIAAHQGPVGEGVSQQIDLPTRFVVHPGP